MIYPANYFITKITHKQHIEQWPFDLEQCVKEDITNPLMNLRNRRTQFLIGKYGGNLKKLYVGRATHWVDLGAKLYNRSPPRNYATLDDMMTICSWHDLESIELLLLPGNIKFIFYAAFYSDFVEFIEKYLSLLTTRMLSPGPIRSYKMAKLIWDSDIKLTDRTKIDLIKKFNCDSDLLIT